MAHTAATAQRRMPVAADNSAEEPAGILLEHADRTKVEMRNGRSRSVIIVGDAVLVA